MKRIYDSSTGRVTVAQNKKHKSIFDCGICLEECTGFKHECEQCHKVLCDSCFDKHMESSITRFIKYDNVARVECPYCRFGPFYPQPFCARVKGRPYKEDMSIRITLSGRMPAFLHPLHDGTDIVGYCSLEHSKEFYEQELSFHVQDIRKLRKFAKPFCELIFDACRRPGAILATEDDMAYLKAQFDKIDAAYVSKCDCCMFTTDLRKFLKTEINPF